MCTTERFELQGDDVATDRLADDMWTPSVVNTLILHAVVTSPAAASTVFFSTRLSVLLTRAHKAAREKAARLTPLELEAGGGEARVVRMAYLSLFERLTLRAHVCCTR